MLSCVCFGEYLTPNIQVAMRWCSALPTLSATTAFVWAFLSKRPTNSTIVDCGCTLPHPYRSHDISVYSNQGSILRFVRKAYLKAERMTAVAMPIIASLTKDLSLQTWLFMDVMLPESIIKFIMEKEDLNYFRASIFFQNSLVSAATSWIVLGSLCQT
ncbi:uncharacterized protein [Pocillopora verrucosa]|uniref:uncharacterized protein isoform X2 n=1 Tax=Pocillopora verrucosa TaxID=203993 RepID=UPI003341C48A